MRTHLRGNALRNGWQTVEIPSGFGGLAQFGCEGHATNAGVDLRLSIDGGSVKVSQ
jgi:hypothetical protein